jgi:DNA polymerase delta subunit 1
MWKCKKLLENVNRVPDFGLIVCRVWEISISVIRKFLSLKKCRYSQWFTVNAVQATDDDKISSLEQEYLAHWKEITPIPPEETKSLVSKPRLLSFDIETYSDKHNAMPKDSNSKHVVFAISVIFQQLGILESRKKYILVYGDCNDIDGVVVIRCMSEIEMIDKFEQLVTELNPEIMMGYNIFSYDYPYLDTRIKRRLLQWKNLGRIVGKPSIMIDPIRWESGAYGHQYIQYLNMDGRISVDMLPLIRREHKLDKYSLDFVSRHFLKKGKHDVSARQMFQIFELMQTASKAKVSICQKYNLSDCNFLSEEKSNENSNVENSNVENSNEKTEEQNKKEEINKIRVQYQTAKESMTRVMAYCVQDSELVIELFEKTNAWISLVEMSNIVGVTIMDLYTHGQQVRCISQLYDLASSKGYILTTREQTAVKFSGGFVYEPIPGLYDKILCFDFASLYPSIMQAFNICYTTLVPPEFESKVPLEMCHIFEFDQEEVFDKDTEKSDENDPLLGDKIKSLDETSKEKKDKNKKSVHRRYLFIKKEYLQGLLPELVKKLVEERRNVRKYLEGVKDENGNIIIEKEKDPLTQTVLNSRQLALKVTANSFFGFLGVQEGGKLPLIEGAMCITAKGRELIGVVNKYLEEKYNARIVYNDTDSSMVDLNLKDPKECSIWGHRLSKEISGLFPPPLKIEFEKAMLMLCLKKKKYAAIFINDKGEYNYNPDKILRRGLLTARRDNCKWIRKLYDTLLMYILKKESYEKAMNLVVSSAQELLAGKVDARELVIIRGLNANYKSPTFCMKVFADELRKKGQIVSPGERLEFIFIEKEGARYLGEKMQLPEMYEDSLNTENPNKIDYLYYLAHAMKNPIDQLIQVGYKDRLSSMINIGYKPRGNYKFRSIINPVEMMIKMIMDGKEVSSIMGMITDSQIPKAPRIKLVFPSLVSKRSISISGASNSTISAPLTASNSTISAPLTASNSTISAPLTASNSTISSSLTTSNFDSLPPTTSLPKKSIKINIKQHSINKPLVLA